MRICSIEGCSKKYYAKGLCHNHYALQLRNGKPEYKSRESICIVENCNERATPYTDYCSFHGYRKRTGIPLDIPKGKANCGGRNFHWKGGTSTYPNHGLMKKIRKELLEEVKYICQFCGGLATEVHHKDFSKNNHSKENLIVCCHKCNSRQRKPKIIPQETSQMPEINRYIYKALKLFGSHEGIAAKMQCSSAYIRMLEQGKKQASVHFMAHLKQIITKL